MAISAPNEGLEAQRGSGGERPPRASSAQLGDGLDLIILPARMRLRFKEGIQRQECFKELCVCVQVLRDHGVVFV